MSGGEDWAVASFLLGREVATELLGGEQPQHSDALLLSPFVLRLRQVLHLACTSLGSDTLRQALHLSKPLVQGLEAPIDTSELMQFQCIDSIPETKETLCPVEEQRPDPQVSLTEEEKRKAVLLFRRGVKLEYIACLFQIANPKAILCWDDWRTYPKSEAGQA